MSFKINSSINTHRIVNQSVEEEKPELKEISTNEQQGRTEYVLTSLNPHIKYGGLGFDLKNNASVIAKPPIIICDGVICDTICDGIVCDAICDSIICSTVCDAVCDQICDKVCDQIWS